MEAWANDPVDYEFEDGDLQQTCQNVLDVFAHHLGKKVVLPVLSQVLQNFKAHFGDYQAEAQAIVLISSFGQGMNDVIKQSEAQQFAQAIVKAMESRHPRVRFEAIRTLSSLSNHLAPKIQKYYEIIIPACIKLNSDPMRKVQVHASTALIEYIEGMSYEQVFDYERPLKQFVKDLYTSQQLICQGNASALLAEICEKLDPEDMVDYL